MDCWARLVKAMARADEALGFFTGLLGPVGAAGFVGNLQQESGLSPIALGDRGRSFGIAQFQGPRRAALEKFAQARGTQPSDFATQLDFIRQEFGTTERSAFNKIRVARTPAEAAEASLSFFRPSDPQTGKRIAFANQLAGIGGGGGSDVLVGSDRLPSVEAQTPMANGNISGLLGDALSNPLFNLGIGLLAAGGPSTTPVSLGQALGQGAQFANRAQQQALQNQLIRSRLEEDARKRGALERLRGAFAGNETLGLLAEVAPDAVAKGLLAQAFPEPLSPLEQATLANTQLLTQGKIAETAAARAGLEDTAISASAGIRALDTVKSIPGADVFLTSPGLISTTRQALSLGSLDPTGLLINLPSEISGIPQDQLEKALNAAETVAKQRNALGQSLSNQAGATGLRSRLESLGEGAGIDVQREVFNQALDRAKREAEKSGTPLDLDELFPGAKAPAQKQFATESDFNSALAKGTVKIGDVVVIGGQQFRVDE